MINITTVQEIRRATVDCFLSFEVLLNSSSVWMLVLIFARWIPFGIEAESYDATCENHYS
jgi:hypothetical protein